MGLIVHDERQARARAIVQLLQHVTVLFTVAAQGSPRVRAPNH